MHYTITIQSTEDIGRVQLTKWLTTLRITGRSLPNTLMQADELLAGGSLVAYLCEKEVAAAKFLKGVVLTPVTYEHLNNTYQAHLAKQEEYAALRDKGAAGDAESAIAYCKLEMEGKISHGANG